MGPLARALGVILIITLHRACYAITKNFVNSSMPEMRPTFVVNFDMATVICQHSADPSDLHLHQMSILCDGKADCYRNPAMHDESFPYCEGRCNSTCSGRGACLFDGSRGQCYCNSGFHGPECELVDNNECEDKPCHWLAHCQNTLGSYYCTCFPGFHGNGHECSDVDECSSGIAHCPEYSNCVNLPGTYFCNCTEGFQPLGLPLERCADIDECEQGLHSCVEPLMCQNEVGSYRCVKECSEGYRLVNGSCIDIDECSEKLAECDKRASCTNTIGGYKCTCEEGFAGNGRTCSPLNDCSQQEGICDRHAFCLGSLRMCICQAGYVGDGLSCYDVNECNAKVNPCEGQSGNRCVNIDGGYICCEDGVDDDVCIREKGAFCSGGCGVHAICYNETCQCMEGFEGDPRVKCDDINECENDKQCAGVGEWCVNMIGGYTCCGPESKEEECKTKCVITSTNDNTTTSELDHEAKGGIRNELSESVSHKSSGGLIVTNGKIISNEYVEIACDIGCPPNSYCENGTCHCDAGYTGNTKQGCHDIDECERSPCTEPDSWCVNLPGSFQCCTTQSNMFDCIGLEIVAGAGMRLGDRESHESNIAKSSSFSASTGRRGGKWEVETFGEWRNFSGGAIVIGRGKIGNGMWNITRGEEEEELAVISDGKKEAERLISLISGFRKGSGPDATERPDIGTQRFIVVNKGVLKTFGSGSAEAELSASGTSLIDKDGGAVMTGDRERTNLTRGGYGSGAARVAVAIGGAQERPILSMNGTITGGDTGDVKTWEGSREKGISLQKGTGGRKLTAGGDGAVNEGDHVMMAVGGAPGGPILEMNGAISVGERKGINGGESFSGEGRQILKITGDSHRRSDGEGVQQSLLGGGASGTKVTGSNIAGVIKEGGKGSRAKNIIVTTDGDGTVQERGSRVHVTLGEANKEPLFKMNATAINALAKGTSGEFIGKGTEQTGDVLAGSSTELSGKGAINESNKGSGMPEGSSGSSNIKWSEVNVGGELGSVNVNGSFLKSGQSSESSHGEITTQDGGSLLIKNVGQPETELMTSQPAATMDFSATEKTISGKDDAYSKTLLIDLTTSGTTAFTTLVTHLSEIPGEEGNAAIHREVDEATVAPKIAIKTSSVTESIETAIAGETNESLPTASENKPSKTTKASFISETASKTTELSSKATVTITAEADLMQITTSRPKGEVWPTSEESAKEEDTSIGEKQFSSTPASSHRSTEQEEKKKGTENEGGLEEGHNLVQQQTTSTTKEPETEVATSLTSLESTTTNAANEQGEKTKYTEGFPTTEQELISQTTVHSVTKPEENTTSKPSSETTEVEAQTENSTPSPGSREKALSTAQAERSTETKTTETSETEASTKGVEIDETTKATETSKGGISEATTDEERSWEEEDETTLATSTFAGETRSEATVPEGEEEGFSTTSAEQQGQTSSKPFVKTTQELPREGSEKETAPSGQKEMSTTEVTVSAEVTSEQDKQTKEASREQHNEGSNISASESTTAGNELTVTATTPGASELYSTSAGKAEDTSFFSTTAAATTTTAESSSITPSEEEGRRTEESTVRLTEFESSSTIRGVQETKKLEHKAEEIITTKPVGEYEVTKEVDEKALVAKLNQQTLSTKGSFTKSKAYTTTEDSEHFTTLKPEEGESLTEKEGRELPQSSTKQTSILKSSVTQEAAGERTAETEQTTTGAGSDASVKPGAETPSTTYYPHETNEDSLKNKEVTALKPNEEVKSTEQRDRDATSTAGEKEMAVTASELYTTISNEREGIFENEINTTMPILESEPSPKSDNRYEKIVTSGKTSEPPEEIITRNPIDGKQGNEAVLETVNTTKVSGAEVETERSEESTTPVFAESAMITTPLKETAEEKTTNQHEDGHETAQSTNESASVPESERPSTKLPQETFSSLSGAPIRSAESEAFTFTSPSSAEESQPSDDGGTTASLEATSIESTPAVFSKENVTAAGKAETTVPSDENNLPVEKYSNETTSKPKIMEKEKYEPTLQGGSDGTTPFEKEVKALSTEAYGISSASETSTTPETGLEIIWATASSVPEASSSSTSQERETTAVGLSSSTSTMESTILKTDLSTKAATHLLGSSTQSATIVNEEKASVPSESSSTISDRDGFAKTEAEGSTTTGTKTIKGETDGEGKVAASTPAGPFGSAEVSNSTTNLVTDIPESRETSEGDGGLVHVTSTTTKTTSNTNEEEGSGGVEEITRKTHTAHISTTVSNEEQPVEGYRSISLLETTKQPGSASTESATIIASHGNTTGQAPKTAAEKLDSLITPDTEQRLHTTTKETLESSTIVSGLMTEKSITASAEEEHKEGKEAVSTTTVPIELSTFETPHFTIGSNGTEEIVSKGDSAPNTYLLTVTTPIEETTFKTGASTQHGSELHHTTALHASTSPSSSVEQHSSTVAETSEMIGTSGTETAHTVVESSSKPFAESPTSATATVTPRKETFGKSSEVDVTLPPSTEAPNEEKEPFTSFSTKTPSTEASESTSSSSKTETYAPTGTSTTTEIEEEVPKKGVSESSKVISPDRQTLSTPERGHKILASTSTEQPKTTMLLELPASESGRKEIAAKGDSGTTEHGVGKTHLNATNTASETSAMHPINESGNFIVTTPAEAATSLPVDQFTSISSETTEITAFTTAVEDKLEDKLSTVPVQEHTTIRSESTTVTPSIPTDSSELGENVPKEEGIPHTSTTASSLTFSNTGEKQTNEVTFEYGETTESTSDVTHSIDKQKAEKGFQSTEETPESTTLNEIVASAITSAATSTATERSATSSPSTEITEHTVSTTLSYTKEANEETEMTTLTSVSPSESEVTSAEKTTATTDAGVIRTTLEETVLPKTANLPERWRTTKETFSLKTTTEESPSNASLKTMRCRSSDHCGLDAYCERRSGACRCFAGFDGAPPHTPCLDLNECERHLDDCHSTARCSNFVGGYTCLCETGYRKNNDGVCVDIDECSEHAGSSCHPKAICTNLPGSYSCQCIAGYAGDGHICIPLDKRHCTIEEWEKMDCGRNHLCLVDGHGNGDCDTCKSGFIMRDGSCSDIDECADAETNVCHADAICKNLVGSFTCQCQPGFKGDGFHCIDVDECQQNPCHPHAACINFPGSYTCKCPDGWDGDGMNQCINPLDEKCRNKEVICKRTNHTSCLSVRLGELVSVCECDANYRYNNETGQCEDINECEENRHSCDPSTSVCVNTDGGYICECAAGYEGTGGICVDVDECERGLAGCNIAAYCENYIGSVGCKCAPGYTGDGIDCTPINVRTSSSNACTKEWIELCRIENKTCHIDDEDVPQCGSCLVGHQPVGGQCLSINGLGNCADPNKNDCDPNADCTDVHPGRHFCTCKVGYIGDGRRCDDVDECSLPGVCDAAADCHNTNGSFTCVCQPGYSGNGFKCVHSTNTNGGPNCHLDPSMCHKKANCLLGGTCKCNDGYSGDGITYCEPEDTIKSSSKEQTSSTVSHSSENEKNASVTFEKTESTTASAPKEAQYAGTSETSTAVLTATSVQGASKLGEPETISTTTESTEKTFVSTTKLASTEDKKLVTTTEKIAVPASSTAETIGAETIRYSASSSKAPADKTSGRGGIALPTEGTDQSGNPYEGSEAGIISSGPPGTSPTSEKDLEGITGDKKHETSHTSIASSAPPSSYIHTPSETTEMPKKLPLEEELRRGSVQVQTKKTAEEKEAKLTEETEKAAKVSAGAKYTGGTDSEVTAGKAAGGDASGEVISKTSEEHDKLTHGALSGGKAMMGIGVKRTDEVSRGGAIKEGMMSSGYIESGAEKQSHGNDTSEAEIKGERTVIKIAIGAPEGTLREGAGRSIMSTKMNGRLDRGKGTAKMTGEVHSGATVDKSQVGINVAKTTSKADKEIAQTKHGNKSASLNEVTKIKKVEGGGTEKLAQQKDKSQHIGEKQTMKESAKEEEKANGTKPSEEQTERHHYRTHFIQKCTSADTSPCHENAKCDVSSGHCVCKNGYYGDGYSACTKITQDCISDADTCDTRAVCDVASRRCKCLKGYVGDGLTCFPDVLDCVLRPNLCSDFASCIGRRCICNEGFTGDGSSCVSLEPVTDCSKCDARAECIDNVCKCRKSYFGNGGTCIADPADCVHYPGLCHRNALCDDESRRCQCLKGFLGDGLDCSHQKSCLNDSTVCHEDADCLPSGVCQCRRGFTGNGIFCNAAILINAEEATSAPKFASVGCGGGCHENEECFSGRCHCLNGYERDDSGKCVDIDECSLPNGCHALAICVNLPGLYTCTCPDGYRGDGKTCKQYHRVNNMAVDCEMDGMTLILTNESELFDGRIFVRGQTENPYCSKKLSSIINNGSDYRFTVPFAHCNVRFEEPDTFAVTVVVQRHPMFITQTADAYDLRCTYPVGSRQVMSHVNVSEMTTADTIVQTGSGPICSLTVTNDEDEVIDTATVGQVLRLALSVQPNDTYAILPRNCFAINLETGERYSLTDQAGCAIDTQLFPEWVHKEASLTTATFRTFKWPDSSMIRFQCDCSACVGSCPKVNCDRRREAIKRRRLRFRYARGVDDKAFDEADNELERSLVSSAHAMTFSHAVHVDEDEEERRAQREVDNWKYQGFTTLEPFEKNILVERICVRAMWIGVSVLPLLLIVALLGALSLLWKRKSSRTIRGDICKGTIYASKNADIASSYLKF